MPQECLLPFNCSNVSLKREPDVDWVVMFLVTEGEGNPPLPFLSHCGWSNIQNGLKEEKETYNS